MKQESEDKKMSIFIQNGQVINPATGTNEVLDLYIEGDRVVSLGKNTKREADRVIDATGCFVMP